MQAHAKLNLTATGELARHIVTTNFADFPTEVVRESKRRIADVLAAASSGSTTPVGTCIKRFAQKNAQAGTALIVHPSAACDARAGRLGMLEQGSREIFPGKG